ncbi:hypothetical protein BDZ94DRAFT_1130311, partial [Collybia nuda]
EWDGWPDGNLEYDITSKQWHDTGNLMFHWAYRVGGGDRKGKETASNWEQGKRCTRSCLGIMECDNSGCQISIRPHGDIDRRYVQLTKGCKCGAQLSHRTCDVMAILWRWSQGVHFRNIVIHANPNAGPLSLIVGLPGVNGPGDSVADISDVYLNADRVSKDRRALKRGADTSGDQFIRGFAEFDDEHPGFILLSVLGKVTVISVQSRFMRSQLVKDTILSGPVNGMVNDAAHGWWIERTYLLMVSSTYCPVLHCWVPGVLSFTNGASAEHFKFHFLAVFQSISLEAESRSIDLTDNHF